LLKTILIQTTVSYNPPILIYVPFLTGSGTGSPLYCPLLLDKNLYTVKWL